MTPIESANPPTVSRAAAHSLVGGTSALGMGIVVERGLGFLSNALAARLGGAATFGAYSLAITTANNISTYAAGGIGSTAIRFSAKYPRDSSEYRTLCRALLIIALVSAGLAAVGSWAAAAPLARLLGRPDLSALLQLSGLSAAGMILLECCRGFLVGQKRLGAIVLLSAVTGVGMMALLPAASMVSAERMIASQGAITVSAVALCLVLGKRLGLWATRPAASGESLGPMLRSVWSFGLIQLAGLIGMNAAGWWMTSLIVKADTSMVQMGFFAVAHQLRNIVALAPSLLTESSLAVMAQEEDDGHGMSDHVMAACTFATTFVSLMVAGIGLLAIPWALPLLYGKAYAAASAAVAIALATAVVHMSSAPAFARLSIVSIRVSGTVNTVWAAYVAGAAAVILLWQGDSVTRAAAQGASIYLTAHLLTTVIGLWALVRRGCVPRGMLGTIAIGCGSALLLAALGVYRSTTPATSPVAIVVSLVIAMTSLAVLWRIGRRHRWLPRLETVRQLLQQKGLWPGGNAPISGVTRGADAIEPVLPTRRP